MRANERCPSRQRHNPGGERTLPEIALADMTFVVRTKNETYGPLGRKQQMNTLKSLRLPPSSRLFAAGVLLVAWSSAAADASVSFGTDPFEGSPVRSIPGRQVVGGEFFIAFNTATEAFVFNGPAFGLSQIRFANGVTSAIPSDANVVVLQTRDNDNNPLTPFGAGNAADLLATRVTVAGPGLFVYFNSSLNLGRLVYSDDLSSNTADLRILARMLGLNGQTGLNELNELPDFSASNFGLAETSAVPEPSSLLMIGGGLGLLASGAALRPLPGSTND